MRLTFEEWLFNNKDKVIDLYNKETDPNYEVKKAYYKEGKKVQVGDYIGNWADCHGEPHWSDNCKYRIKPECPCEGGKSKYKPYVTVDEFIQDFQERFPTAFPRPAFSMPLVWVRGRENGVIYLIDAFGKDHVRLDSIRPVRNFCQLFEYYVYLDGSPCGMEVKE